MPKMTYKQLVKLMVDNGWYLTTTNGSHRKFEHLVHKNFVIVAYHRIGDMVPSGTLSQTLRDARLK